MYVNASNNSRLGEIIYANKMLDKEYNMLYSDLDCEISTTINNI